mgnify:CR=1 FL=1
MPFPVKHAAFANKGLLKTPTQKQLSRRKTNVYRLTVNNFDIYFSLYLCKLENSHISTSKISASFISNSESGTERPFSHFETVCLTTFSLAALFHTKTTLLMHGSVKIK